MSAELSTQTNTGLSIFDSNAFAQMGAIASQLAASSLIPDTLKGTTKNGNFTAFPIEQTTANCFRVVEQAQRWGLSPFAVMDSASIVHGRLMWEGKLIAAAVKVSIGVRLRYEYSGNGDSRKVAVIGEIDGMHETITGTVADWKTTGKNSPWDKLANRDQMLAYRGARQWARRYAPEVILGVYAPDEFDEGDMKNVTPERKPLVRSEPIKPGASQKEKATAANPEKKEPEGKQTKERHLRDGILKDVTARETSSGKNYYCAIFSIPDGEGGAKKAEFFTFSETLNERLLGSIGEKLRFTFTQGAKGGFQLEDFSEIEKGGLI